MNDLQVFVFDNQQIRIVDRNGDPWFVAKDVCDILGLENNRDVLAKMLDEDEKGVEKIYTLGGGQEMNIINESGLYNLVFRSNKPEAKVFRKWVTSEVLPSIRKKGFYAVPGLMERLESLMERNTKFLNDPEKAAYEELEGFIARTLTVEYKPIHRVYLHNLYHAYEKEVEKPLGRHVFMHKIAMDHPEYRLKYDRNDWYFIGCDTKRMI